jgi:hypothetical protein
MECFLDAITFGVTYAVLVNVFSYEEPNDQNERNFFHKLCI